MLKQPSLIRPLSATVMLLAASVLSGCGPSKTPIVREYEKVSGNELNKDPAGSITLAWFKAHMEQAKQINQECKTKQQKESDAYGTPEYAVCKNALTAISFQHHYDNLR